MKIYEMKNDQGGTRTCRYAYASGYGPVEAMPYFDYMPAFRVQFDEFWQINRRKPGLYIEPGASEWPDLLGCGNPPPAFFVSETVIDDLAARGIRFLRTSRFPIAEVASPKLQAKVPPKYFVGEAAPGIRVDFASSGITLRNDGYPVLTKEQRMSPPIWKLDLESWDGSDLFAYSNVPGGSRLKILCTEKVLEISKKQQWKNVIFQRQAISGMDPFANLR